LICDDDDDDLQLMRRSQVMWQSCRLVLRWDKTLFPRLWSYLLHVWFSVYESVRVTLSLISILRDEMMIMVINHYYVV